MESKKENTIAILGCGWLGLPLAKQWVDLGFTVKGSTTQESKLEQISSAGVTAFIVRCQEDSCSGLSTFLNQVDTLIVAIPPGVRSNPKRQFDLVIENIQKEIVAQKIKKVLFISSTSVYGKTQGLINETTPTAPVTKSANQLVKCEQMLLNSSAFDTSIIRFGGLIGPNRHPIYTLAKREEIDHPTGKINFIHLDDCIALIQRCVASFQKGSIYNGVAPFHPSREEYYTSMAKKAGITLPPFNKREGGSRIISAQKAEEVLGMDFLVENLLTLK